MRKRLITGNEYVNRAIDGNNRKDSVVINGNAYMHQVETFNTCEISGNSHTTNLRYTNEVIITGNAYVDRIGYCHNVRIDGEAFVKNVHDVENLVLTGNGYVDCAEDIQDMVVEKNAVVKHRENIGRIEEGVIFLQKNANSVTINGSNNTVSSVQENNTNRPIDTYHGSVDNSRKMSFLDKVSEFAYLTVTGRIQGLRNFIIMLFAAMIVSNVGGNSEIANFIGFMIVIATLKYAYQSVVSVTRYIDSKTRAARDISWPTIDEDLRNAAISDGKTAHAVSHPDDGMTFADRATIDDLQKAVANLAIYADDTSTDYGKMWTTMQYVAQHASENGSIWKTISVKDQCNLTSTMQLLVNVEERVVQLENGHNVSVNLISEKDMNDAHEMLDNNKKNAIDIVNSILATRNDVQLDELKMLTNVNLQKKQSYQTDNELNLD